MVSKNSILCVYMMSFLIGIDEVLAKHIANIFVRDPLCLFAEDLDQDIENDVGHFEVGLSI